MSESNQITRNITEHKIEETDVSVYAYDKALVEDLRARFETSPVDSQINKTIQIGPAENMFSILGTLSEDKIVMPFVSLERLDWQLNMDRQRIPNFCRR